MEGKSSDTPPPPLDHSTPKKLHPGTTSDGTNFGTSSDGTNYGTRESTSNGRVMPPTEGKSSEFCQCTSCPCLATLVCLQVGSFMCCLIMMKSLKHSLIELVFRCVLTVQTADGQEQVAVEKEERESENYCNAIAMLRLFVDTTLCRCYIHIYSWNIQETLKCYLQPVE